MSEITQKTILLVEDESIIALREISQLEGAPYRVLHALDGRQAVQIALEGAVPIDLILMDIDLGEGIDGTEAAKEIHKKIDVPILFLSSHTEKEIVQKTEKISSYGYVVKNSNFTVLDASIKMAFRLFDAQRSIKVEHRERDEACREMQAANGALMLTQAKLNESMAKLEIAQEVAKIGFWGYDTIHQTLEWTTGVRQIFEMPPECPTPAYAAFFDFVHSEDKAFVEEKVRAQLRPLGARDLNYVYRIVTGTGRVKYLDHTGRQVLNDKGEVIEVFGSVQDITPRIKIENALKATEMRFHTLLENVSNVSVQGYGSDGTTKYWNKASENLYGYTEKEALGRSLLDLIIPDEMREGVRGAIGSMVASGQPIPPAELSLKRKDGSRVSVYSSHAVVETESDGFNLFCIDIDLTGRKNDEKKIERLLEEKETILKEVHHRIKNNMNTIYGLLSLQAAAQKNAGSRNTLQDAAGRVQSMMLLYDKLYCSENHQEMSVRLFLESLIEQIIAVFPSSVPIERDICIGDFILSGTMLSPLGIIINELITNSMKYAFAGFTDNRITVSAVKRDSLVTVMYQDNGIGLSESVTFENSSGFGMQLVSLLVNQIGGTIRIERNAGTKYVLEFSV